MRFNKKKSVKGRHSLTDDNTIRKIGFWCFNPALCMQSIAGLKPRSILLTSGTLSPLESFSAELGLNFEHKLENPHVINPKQVMVSTLSHGIQN
jgi:regulator of telomere elongation helicase 1